MPYQDNPFRRDRPEDLRPSDADKSRVASFALGSEGDDDDDYEGDEYEGDGEIVDPVLSRWLTRVMNRHA